MLAPVQLAPGAAKDKDLCRFFLQSRFLLQHIVQFHIVPFGICAGSENQGGQHEARNKPVQAATSHFTTMTVDGVLSLSFDNFEFNAKLNLFIFHILVINKFFLIKRSFGITFVVIQ
jgi:hypothetical protein